MAVSAVDYQHVDVHDPRPGTWTVKVVWNNGRMHLQDKPLKPGSYAMLCPIGGPQGPHYKLGQLQEFEIQ